MSPDDALKFIEEAERVAAKARSFAHKAAHSASLTVDEQNAGWLPLFLLMYRLWQTFIGPQVEFTVQSQIGVAEVLNKFGAGIDVSKMQAVLGSVRKSIAPFKPVAKPQQGINSGPSTIGSAWEVGA